MEEAVSVVADPRISISRTESLRQGLPSKPWQVSQSRRASGGNPRGIEISVLALNISQGTGASRESDSDD